MNNNLCQEIDIKRLIMGVIKLAKEIIFVIDDVSGIGGVARVTAQIVNELVKNEKYNVTVLSITPPQKNVYYIDSRIKVLDLGIVGWNIRKHTLMVKY